MKKIILALLIVFSLSSQAQELKWHTNVKDAITASNKEKKPLMLFFTGSDWCGWCIRLQKEVLMTPEFTKWAKENVVLLELDYPNRTPQLPEIREQNAQLKQIFQIQGYPTVFFSNVVNKDGKTNFNAFGRTGYVAGGPSAWIAEADKILQVK